MELKLTRPLAFFDIETTGVNVVTDRIIEISILKVLVNGGTETKTQRINPTVPIPSFATAIHGIKDEDVIGCPCFTDVAGDLAQFLSNCDLAGYNSNKFDIPFLAEEFYRAEVEFDLKNRKFIDVQNIFHKMEQRTLKAAYKFYCNKEHINAHSAEGDTLATYEILKAQIEKYNGTEYIDSEGNISYPVTNDMQALHEFSSQNRNADLIGHIIFNQKGIEIFNFGKHKGKSVEEIFNIEPAYYDWMMKSDFPFSTKHVITSIKLRGFNKGAANIK